MINILILDTKKDRVDKIKEIILSFSIHDVNVKTFVDTSNDIKHEIINAKIILVHTNDNIFHQYYLDKIISHTVIIGYSGGDSAQINTVYKFAAKKNENYLIYYVNALPSNGDFSINTENDLKEGIHNLIKTIDKISYSELSDVLNLTDVKLKDNLSYLINQLEFLINGNNQIDNQKTLDLENKRNELLKDFN